MQLLRHYDRRLDSQPARVVIRPFYLAMEPRNLHPQQAARIRRVVDAVLALSEAECESELAAVNADFAVRHLQTARVHDERFAQIAADIDIPGGLSAARRELIGAYFCHEYSYSAAAVMNPSIVRHPDQGGLAPGEQRFIMSVRSVGEGHISSISFREGVLTAAGDLTLLPQPDVTFAADGASAAAPDGAIIVRRPPSVRISGTVIFPHTPAQRNGLEDLRLTRFEDESGIAFYGTYTAYSGLAIRSELLSTRDFAEFMLSPMSGDAAVNKGMALFPRRIGGGYAMLGRQDGESIYFLKSDSLTVWSGGERILAPHFPWELVQIGNCGPPIELDEGWLILTHGVGAMRKYSIGAALLDKADPRKVLARSPAPLLTPSADTREGYVPNVVYTCGALKHGDQLFIPYAVADSAISFAMADIRSLLAVLA